MYCKDFYKILFKLWDVKTHSLIMPYHMRGKAWSYLFFVIFTQHALYLRYIFICYIFKANNNYRMDWLSWHLLVVCTYVDKALRTNFYQMMSNVCFCSSPTARLLFYFNFACFFFYKITLTEIIKKFSITYL